MAAAPGRLRQDQRRSRHDSAQRSRRAARLQRGAQREAARLNRCACPPSSWPRRRSRPRVCSAPSSRDSPNALARIEYAPVAQVGAGYRLADISEPKLRARGGFGFLVPRSEGLRSLGTVFNSFLFPGRAPEREMASFTTFLGGATDTAIRACSDRRNCRASLTPRSRACWASAQRPSCSTWRAGIARCRNTTSATARSCDRSQSCARHSRSVSRGKLSGRAVAGCLR